MGRTILKIDKRRMLLDGTYPIKIKVGYGTNLYLSTGVYVKEEDWEQRTQMYMGKSGKRINAILEQMLTNVHTRILDLKERGIWNKISPKQVKEMLLDVNLDTPRTGAVTLGKAFEQMTEGKSESSKRATVTANVWIKKFCGKDSTDITLDEITRAWVEDFEKSMAKLAINTRYAYLKTVKRAFGWAIERDLTKNNPFKNYRIAQEETKMRVLPVDTMRTLLSMDLPLAYREYRDMFMLTFYLIGINLVDLSRLTAKDIVNGRVEYRRAKTGKLYSIKIEPEAMDILNRYKGKQHLLRMFDGRSFYKSYQGTCNNALARLGRPKVDREGNLVKAKNGRVMMEPLFKDLSLYWARYSWATYAADLDVPMDTISEALGHNHGAKVTGIYVKYNRDKVDAANRKVIDYVLGRLS